MADGLVISGGGSIAVAPDALSRHALEIAGAGFEASGCSWQIAAVAHSTHRVDAAAPVVRLHTLEAIAALGELEQLATATAESLRLAAQAYGVAERSAESAMEEISARIGYAAGFFLPFAVAAIVPSIITVAIPAAVAVHLIPGASTALKGVFGDWLTDNRSQLTDPFVLALVKLGVSSADDFGIGLLHLPPPVYEALADSGLIDVSTSAAVLTLAAVPLGILGETPVATRSVHQSKSSTAASGLVERIHRIPKPEEEHSGAQIRIDRVASPGEADRFEVFIAGTVDFDPRPAGEPWDMTSNVNTVAELPAGSYRAVEQAMREAGVTPHSSVVFTGHSQGGLVAASLAASGDWSSAGLVTIGAPTGHIDLPNDLAAIQIEHTDDLVPALSGVRSNYDAVLVERRAYLPGEPLPDSIMPGHERYSYLETAALAESASDPRLTDALRSINTNVLRAESVETTYYRADRVEHQP